MHIFTLSFISNHGHVIMNQRVFSVMAYIETEFIITAIMSDETYIHLCGVVNKQNC